MNIFKQQNNQYDKEVFLNEQVASTNKDKNINIPTIKLLETANPHTYGSISYTCDGLKFNFTIHKNSIKNNTFIFISDAICLKANFHTALNVNIEAINISRHIPFGVSEITWCENMTERVYTITIDWSFLSEKTANQFNTPHKPSKINTNLCRHPSNKTKKKSI